jgi:hypothetical protein
MSEVPKSNYPGRGKSVLGPSRWVNPGATKGFKKDLAVCLLNEGLLVLPDGRWYLSAADCDEDIEATLEAMENNTA